MEAIFTAKDFEMISRFLGKQPQKYEGALVWDLSPATIQKSLVISLHLACEKTGLEAPVVSVQTMNGFYELHNIVKYLTFEPDEVIFIAEDGNRISSLIVGGQGSCSLYSNIDKEILNADFSTLPPAELMAAMQLSIFETALNSD